MYNFSAEEKGMMKIIFNHYSMLSDNLVVQNTDKVFATKESYRKSIEIFEQIMNAKSETIYLQDGIYARGVFTESIYAISLVDRNGMIQIESQGAISIKADKFVRPEMLNNFSQLYGERTISEYITAPIVYDLLFPTIVRHKEITKWTGDFTKRMGAVAFLTMTMEMMKTTK